MKTILRLALAAALLAIAVGVFAGSVYLVASDATRWPPAIVFAAAVLATALLLTATLMNDGRPSTACTATHVQVSMGCRTSIEYTGFTAEPSSIIYHYEHSYAVGSQRTFTRPRAGSIEQPVRCHRCGTDIHLTVHSVKAARRDALLWSAQIFAGIFGGWSVFFWFYFTMPPKDTIYLGVFGLFGAIASPYAIGEQFKIWASATLDRAANWHRGDHGWFSPDQRALANPLGDPS